MELERCYLYILLESAPNRRLFTFHFNATRSINVLENATVLANREFRPFPERNKANAFTATPRYAHSERQRPPCPPPPLT